MEDKIKKTKLCSTCRSYQLHCNRHKSVNYQPLNIGLPRGARCSRAPTHTYMWLASIIIENGQLMITYKNILSSRLNLIISTQDLNQAPINFHSAPSVFTFSTLTRPAFFVFPSTLPDF